MAAWHRCPPGPGALQQPPACLRRGARAQRLVPGLGPPAEPFLGGRWAGCGHARCFEGATYILHDSLL